jgi:hypothetical protein
MKTVPRLLNSDHKEHHIAACYELKEQPGNNPNFISNITINDDLGFMDTILRQSNNHFSGRLPSPPLKKPEKFETT